MLYFGYLFPMPDHKDLLLQKNPTRPLFLLPPNITAQTPVFASSLYEPVPLPQAHHSFAQLISLPDSTLLITKYYQSLPAALGLIPVSAPADLMPFLHLSTQIQAAILLFFHQG